MELVGMHANTLNLSHYENVKQNCTEE
jgi:hypothetical protein